MGARFSHHKATLLHSVFVSPLSLRNVTVLLQLSLIDVINRSVRLRFCHLMNVLASILTTLLNQP